MDCCLILFVGFFFQSSTPSGGPFINDVRLHPDSFSANQRLGEYYLKENSLAAAIPYLEKARQLNPSDYINGYDLALTYLQLKRLDEARAMVNDLIRQGDKAELHNLLGDIEEARGQITEAAREYEKATRMDPTEKNLFDLGSDLLNHRGFEPARKVFDFAVKRYPQSAKLRVGLGISYYSLGQYDDAVQTLCQAVDLDPRDARALDFLGKMCDISPQYAGEVSKRLFAFARKYPTNAAAQYYCALSLRKRTVGQSAASGRAAEAYLRRAVELKPDFTDAHYELGVLYQDLQQERKAIGQFEIAVEQRPNFVPAHYHLAQLYKRVRRPDLSRQEFSRIEELKHNAK